MLVSEGTTLPHLLPARRSTPRVRKRRTPAQTFQALHEIAVALSGVLDPAALARIVADRASVLLGADAVALYLWDQEASLLRPLYSNDPRALSADTPLKLGQGIIGRAFAQREPVVVDDYRLWPQALALATSRGLRSALAVPLVVAERAVGALIVRSYTQRNYTVEDINVLSLLAASLAPALEAARLFTEAERLSQEAIERASELRRSEERFRALLRNTSDVIAILDPRGLVRYVSPTVESVWGLTPEQVEGLGIVDWVHADDRPRMHATLEAALEQPRATLTAEIRMRHADGSLRDFEMVVINQLADPAVAGIVSTYHDITERKSFESDLRYLAFHDSLLDMPNRVLFMERLERALAAGRNSGRTVGVIFVDLDNFKFINDSLGHEAGDQMLMAVAERLRMNVRGEDSTARLGGDEFTVLMERVDTDDDAINMARRILTAIQEPVVLVGHEVVPSASIGIALSGPGQDQADVLLRCADQAMYHAKANGKGRFELFDVSMSLHATERLELEADLRRALEREELRVYYQPIVALDTGNLCGAEALVRWEHPGRGLVVPDQFIPLAEMTGLIVPIGEWVLREACLQTQAWREAYPSLGLRINVNLSGKQLQRRDLGETVAHILLQTRLPPSALCLEVTESVAMEDADWSVANLRRLKQLGVKIAMDDFGTGYSSLSYLKRFPVDEVKIDRSFVDGLGQDPDDTAIVRAVVALAQALNLQVTAEGIETHEQLLHIRALGCERGQGYLFSRPVPADVAQTLFATNALDGLKPWPRVAAAAHKGRRAA
jgi:diguanylate cyclase (GGDEF)-like protein/PAS domain S-box-containing protein